MNMDSCMSLKQTENEIHQKLFTLLKLMLQFVQKKHKQKKEKEKKLVWKGRLNSWETKFMKVRQPCKKKVCNICYKLMFKQLKDIAA